MLAEDDIELAYRKREGRRRCKCIAAVVCIILAFCVGLLIGYFVIPTLKRGKKPVVEKSGDDKRAALQAEFREFMEAEKLRENLRYFSERPHIAGSPRQQELAEELVRRMRSYGFDRVEMPEYRVLLSYPQQDKPNLVTLLNSNGSVAFQTKGTEQIVDPGENDTLLTQPFLGYAPNGTVEGELVYVNYGRVEDFIELKEKLGVNVTGKIAIMRYGMLFRGDKVKNAADNGAIGALLFSDPRYGHTPNDTYPHAPWLPASGVQRGSVYTGHGMGDPLTPGLPSIPGIYRRPYSESDLPTIPAQPMGYGDAIKFLTQMQGPVAPDEWIGNLNITYKLGPSLANGKRVRLEVNNKLEVKPIYNVIGTIYGKEEPDRYVLMGNHRDSWVFGAVDASSGTAVTTEISRGLGKLLKKGWRPRRTIMMCSWGGEEYSLIGSREFVEQHSKALSTRGVAYLNMDIAVGGNYVPEVSGSPLLKSALMSQLQKVTDPNAHGDKETMFDIMVERTPSRSSPEEPVFSNVGSGSDYAQFYHLVGVPVSDFTYVMGYKNRPMFYPVYHSQHDTYNWMIKFVDPDFLVHKSMAQLGGSTLINIADAPLLPIGLGDYAQKLNESFASLEKNQAIVNQSVSLEYLGNATKDFINAVVQFKKVVKEIEGKSDEQSFALLRRLNDQMVQVEKSFIYSYGLPGRPFVRHVLFAPELHNKYGTSTFPGISDAIYAASQSEGSWDDVREQISIVLECVMAATEAIQILGPRD